VSRLVTLKLGALLPPFEVSTCPKLLETLPNRIAPSKLTVLLVVPIVKIKSPAPFDIAGVLIPALNVSKTVVVSGIVFCKYSAFAFAVVNPDVDATV
jgi:hypothetical protein